MSPTALWYYSAVDQNEVMQRAVALHRAGRLQEAESLYLSIPQNSLHYPDVLHMLGIIASQRNKHSDAIALLEKSALRRPTSETFANLAAALVAAKKLDQAVVAYRNAIKLGPMNATVHSALGGVFITLGNLEAAIESCRKAIVIDGGLYSAHSNLGIALLNGGQIAEAIESYRTATRCRGATDSTHSNLLFGVNHDPQATGETILAEHRQWGQRYADKPIPSQDVNRAPNRRLKIGYVSGDLRTHSVAYFLEPILAHHDAAAVEIFVYAHVKDPDEVTARLSQMAHHWRDINPLTDKQSADQIRQDKIDILVDLAGHTDSNRLPIFARKPAPIQVSYLGYPCTTGLSAIDYRITDGHADPPGMTETHYSETLVRLPETFLCFRPYEPSPEVAPSPVTSVGEITFGSFNSFAKINLPLITLWSKLLNRLPKSRLLLKARVLNDQATRKRLLKSFTDLGVASERIELHAGEPKIADHLRMYGRVDIALDTYPYHGTTTTCEALWMGVPVVTLAGDRHISRVGVSILRNMGLDNLIASGPDEYVEIAANLASDHERLIAMRSTLRQMMLSSQLMDEAKFARNIESAYRQMWTTYTEKKK